MTPSVSGSSRSQAASSAQPLLSTNRVSAAVAGSSRSAANQARTKAACSVASPPDDGDAGEERRERAHLVHELVDA